MAGTPFEFSPEFTLTLTPIIRRKTENQISNEIKELLEDSDEQNAYDKPDFVKEVSIM